MVLQEIHKLCGSILPCTTTEGGAGHNTNNQVRNFPPTFCFIFIYIQINHLLYVALPNPIDFMESHVLRTDIGIFFSQSF